MPANRRAFVCQECGKETSKWVGQCTSCDAWDSFEEVATDPRVLRDFGVRADDSSQTVMALADVPVKTSARIPTRISELDRVLGGGLVGGAVVLLGGDPGIGKSTLLLQCLSAMHDQSGVLYVTGEESLQQVAMRAERIGTHVGGVRVLSETQLERVLAALAAEKPGVLAIDSIQTLFTAQTESAPGSVSQVRECAAALVRWAKQQACTVILVGHVTKEGALAGPRVLEHMVDTVLYFEGDKSSRFRLIRAVKNRFGAVNEIGVFAMTEQGLKGVENPSAMFVPRHREATPGSVVLATQEGNRPLLVEIQALVDVTASHLPKRLSVGLDAGRLGMLLAVLHRHAQLSLSGQDVFVNVAGGVRINETGADLAVILALASSVLGRAIDPGTVAFGEVGLSGEIRPVTRGDDRIHEAAKLGFRRVLLPNANRPRTADHDIDVVAVARVDQLLDLL